MHGFPGNPVPVAALRAEHWAADVIYTPIETAFIKAAAAKGAKVLTGGGMCVHQAAEAFRLFIGVEPDIKRMHRDFRAGARGARRCDGGARYRQPEDFVLMKTSIATVCLSGGLSEKLQAIAAAGFRGVEIFESDLLSYNGTPADVAKEMADLGLKAITFQPFRDFEGMPEPQRSRTFDRAERKFDVDAGDRLRSADGVQQRVAGIARRHRPRGCRFPRARRAGRQARLARRLRGAGLGPPHQRLPRRLGGGAPRRPSSHRPRARYLPHLRAQDRPQADAGHSSRPDFPGAACRRALARHGFSVLEPAFPLLPGAGGIAARRLHAGAAGHRL